MNSTADWLALLMDNYKVHRPLYVVLTYRAVSYGQVLLYNGQLDISVGPPLTERYLQVLYTVEPLNKGHLRTEGIVPYSEVVPYWEVSQKKLNIDVKSPLKNSELIRGALFQ